MAARLSSLCLAFAAVTACRDLRPGAVELAPHVYVVTTEKHVDVRGSSFHAARAAAVDASWQETARQDLPSFTKVTFHWQYWTRSAGGVCFVKEASVELEIAHSFPRWVPWVGTASSETMAWNAWLSLREKVAKRKAEAALKGARAIVVALETLPAEETCERANRVANELASNLAAKATTDVDAVLEADEIEPPPAPIEYDERYDDFDAGSFAPPTDAIPGAGG